MRFRTQLTHKPKPSTRYHTQAWMLRQRQGPPLPCWSAEILGPRSERRTWFGNKNTRGRSRRQIWFCGKFRKLESHSSAPDSSEPRHRASSPDPYTSQTADAASCPEEREESDIPNIHNQTRIRIKSESKNLIRIKWLIIKSESNQNQIRVIIKSESKYRRNQIRIKLESEST